MKDFVMKDFTIMGAGRVIHNIDYVAVDREEHDC